MKLNSKTLLLIDGLGGIFTALLLGFVIPLFQVGIADSTLHTLAFIGLGYGLYSLTCYLFVKADHAKWLKIVAIANILYCVMTAGILFQYYQQLKLIGWIYFIGEIIVILTLAKIELESLKSV